MAYEIAITVGIAALSFILAFIGISIRKKEGEDDNIFQELFSPFFLLISLFLMDVNVAVMRHIADTDGQTVLVSLLEGVHIVFLAIILIAVFLTFILFLFSKVERLRKAVEGLFGKKEDKYDKY